MTRLENRCRRLADADGPIAGGVVLLGDSALHTNPTAGRGVSLAFARAQLLATTLDEAADPRLLYPRLRRVDRRQYRRVVPAPGSG